MPSHDVLLVIGDRNAKVGRSNVGREKTMGKNGCGEMNENGERLADICDLNDLVVGGTIFGHKQIHKLTWTSPAGNVKNQIDHVLINGRRKHSLHNDTVKRAPLSKCSGPTPEKLGKIYGRTRECPMRT